MKEHLKRLTSESAYYGISTIGARMLGFLLVPFYSNVLLTAEYGVVSNVYAYLAFLTVIFTFGLEPAFMRYYADCPEERRKILFSAPLLSISIVSAIIAAACHVFQAEIAVFWSVPMEYTDIIPLGVWTIVIDSLNTIPFATLRMQNRPRRFAFIRLASIVVNVALNMYFILGLGMGIDAVFLAGIISSGVSTLLLLPTIAGLLRFRIDWTTLKPLLAFGLPALPALLASITVSTIDKPMINWLMDSSAVGVYHTNYKLGIFMMLIVSMFQFAWQPFYLQLKDDPNAKPMFARVMTYFTLIAMAVTLAVSLFIADLVAIPVFGRHIIHPDYWAGLGIVPIILFSYVWTGMYYISNAGIFIQKKTKYLPWISGAGAVTNVVTNYLWIPAFGMYGAAFATLAAYMVMAALSYAFTQRCYPMRYEYARLAKIMFASAVPVVIWYSNIGESLVPPLVEKMFLLALFAALLLATRFFSRGELAQLKSMAARFVPSGASQRG